MSTIPAVSLAHTFNGDLSATAKVDAASLDSALGSLASAHNAAKAALDVVLDNSNQLSAGSVGLAQLDAGVRELLSDVSGAVYGATAKLAVDSVGTSNIVMVGEQTINGKTLVAGNRVLLSAQTNAVENGIWIVATGAWNRAVDLPAGGSVGDGWYLVVAGGSQAGTAYVSASPGTNVVGTNTLSFVSTGTLGVTSVGVASSDLSVTGSPITSSGSIGLTIAANVVTNAKAAQMSANTVKANLTGATANASDVPVATLRTALGTGTPSATTFLRGDGTWSTPSQAYSNFAVSATGGTLTLSATLSTNRSFTFPDVAGTIPTLENNQTWTGTNTFNGNTILGAATMASARITDVGSAFASTVDVTTLTADRTITIPDASGTIPTLDANGNLVLGATPTAGNGLLQLASGTTKANGIAFGTDTFLYRSYAGLMYLDGQVSADRGLYLTTGTVTGYSFVAHSLAAYLVGSLTNHPMQLRTNNTERAIVKTTGQIRFVPLSADPAGAETGDVYYNSTTNKLRVYNGAWVDLH
jgi:hypothetical protein